MTFDEEMMARAIGLAKRGEGLTRPNPPVGAVLARDGEVVAEGWHRGAGGPHAEAECLRAAGGNLASATLYVTLEPCCTHGRTPPCTGLVVEKGIGRVVVAVADPNPAHAGRGLEILRQAGIEVVCGVCEKEGRELVAPFGKFMATGLPFVTLKLAITLDGRIADHAGGSRWITGSAARERVQAMRRRADAVMVGAATVRADDPSLLPRPDEGRRPWRVVVGRDIPQASKVLADGAANRTLVREGPLEAVLRELAGTYGAMHVLCEGGGKLAAGLVEGGLVDEYVFFVAPKLMGADGVPCFASAGRLAVGAEKLAFTSVEMVGEDLVVRAKTEN